MEPSCCVKTHTRGSPFSAVIVSRTFAMQYVGLWDVLPEAVRLAGALAALLSIGSSASKNSSGSHGRCGGPVS